MELFADKRSINIEELKSEKNQDKFMDHFSDILHDQKYLIEDIFNNEPEDTIYYQLILKDWLKTQL